VLPSCPPWWFFSCLFFDTCHAVWTVTRHAELNKKYTSWVVPPKCDEIHTISQCHELRLLSNECRSKTCWAWEVRTSILLEQKNYVWQCVMDLWFIFRSVSTAHATVASIIAFYLLYISNIFRDDAPYGPVMFRSTLLSQFSLGVSITLPFISLSPFPSFFVFSLWFDSTTFVRNPNDFMELWNNLQSCNYMDHHPLLKVYTVWYRVQGVAAAILSSLQKWLTPSSLFYVQFSCGYFLADMAMMYHHYPDLGGLEFVSFYFPTLASLY
jgi:hypothetical protein